MRTNRNFKRFIIALLWSIPAIFMAGCQDDSISPWVSGEDEGNDLESAVEWYNAQKAGNEVLLSGSVATRSGENMLFFTEPSWKYYYKSEDSRCRALDVVLTDRIGLDFVLQQNNQMYEKTGQHRFRRSYSRLVILTSKTNGKRIGFIMTLLPSVNYVTHYGDRIGKITYLKRDPDFDGMIFFHNLDGAFAGGWRYENGNVTGWIPELLPADKVSGSGEEVFYFEMLPAAYRIKNICTTRSGTEGETIDGGELEEVDVIGNGNNSGSSGGGFIVIGGGGGFYPGDNTSDPGAVSGGGGGGGKGSNPGTTPVPAPKVEIDQSVKNNPKINKLLEALMNINDSYLKKLIARYQGENNNYNLKYVVDADYFKDRDPGTRGVCVPMGKEGVIIYLNPTQLSSARSIEVARTILHESLHAYIFSINRKANASLGITTLDKDWETYTQKTAQHEAMAMREIDNMADELERIHRNSGEYDIVWTYWDDVYSLEERKLFYEGLAWDGLHNTTLYKNMDKDKKEHMQKVYKAVKDICKYDWE